MQNLKELSRGWRSMRKSITELIARVNALSNQTITRVEANSDGEAGTAELLEVGEKSSILKLNSDPSAVATGTPSAVATGTPSGGTSIVLPFTVTLGDSSVDVSAGHYLVVNTATAVSAATNGAGSFIYAQIKHSEAGVLDETTPFAILFESTELDATTLDIDDTYIEYSNILLAEVIDDAVTQYRSGNCELVLSFTNGKYHYTAAFEGGSA